MKRALFFGAFPASDLTRKFSRCAGDPSSGLAKRDGRDVLSDARATMKPEGGAHPSLKFGFIAMRFRACCRP
jgi:hypothetical protein